MVAPIRSVATSVALLSCSLAAQATVDTVTLTDIVSRARVADVTDVRTLSAGTVLVGLDGTGATATAGPNRASATTLVNTRSVRPDRIEARITTDLMRESAIGGSASVDSYELLVRFQIQAPFVGRFSIEPVVSGSVVRTLEVDAFNDGTLDYDFKSTPAPWALTQALQPGVVEFRVSMSASLQLGSTSTAGGIGVVVALENFDGCGLTQLSQSCVTAPTRIFRMNREFDASYTALLLPLGSSQVAQSFLVLGFSDVNLPLPVSILAGGGPCILVPSPDVVVPIALGVQTSIPAPGIVAPFEAYLQAFQLQTDGTLLGREAYRIGCF